MRNRIVRRTGSILLALLLCSAATGASAQDWVTKGGTFLRTGRAEEPMSFMSARQWWSLEDGPVNQTGDALQRPGFGASATQPVVIGNTIYHTAGKHLWRIQLGSDGRPISGADGARPLDGGRPRPPRPNADPNDRDGNLEQGRTPSSTPSYSAQTGNIYWGTPYGELWVYRTQSNTMDSIELAYPCQISGSPLVMQIPDPSRHSATKEVVVIGDRPVPGSACDSSIGGNIWAVWGFGPNEQMRSTRFDELLTGGWVTPSAVPLGPASLLIGADAYGGGGGVAVRVNVSIGPGGEVRLEKGGEFINGQNGFAGTFVTPDGLQAYWLDVNGTLFHYQGDQATPITLIPPGAQAFTNTEPAIGPDGSIYVTLRNYLPPGASGPLRPDPGDPASYDPGQAGAIAKISPDLSRVQLQPLPRDGTPGRYRAINTAPLILHSPGGLEAVAFGDVNGNMYLYSAADLTPLDAWKDGAQQVPGAISLLQPGETAARAGYTYSQRTGVSTDPMLASRLLMAGVNYTADPTGRTQAHHRLVAYYNPLPYNLAWGPANLNAQGDEITIDGQVLLDTSLLGPGITLGTLRPNANIQ